MVSKTLTHSIHYRPAWKQQLETIFAKFPPYPDARCRKCDTWTPGDNLIRGLCPKCYTDNIILEKPTIAQPDNNLTFSSNLESGDRIQFVGNSSEIAAVIDHWKTVEDVQGCLVYVKENNRPLPITTVYQHQKATSAKQNTLIKDNIQICTNILNAAILSGANPLVIEFWSAKLAQAQKMLSDLNLASIWSRACACGCGHAVRSGNFLQGHDTRFNGMIRRLDAGEIELSELPMIVQKIISADDPLVSRARNKVWICGGRRI